MSPPVFMPPSVTIGDVAAGLCRCSRSRAAATSSVAVTCGTPIPSTSRVVHAKPAPTPTKMGGRALVHELVGGVTAHRVADQDRHP